jgi:hypothetical protein
MTGFCYPGGILQLFRRQDHQILRLPTAAARSHPANYRLRCWEASSANSSGTGSATRKKCHHHHLQNRVLPDHLLQIIFFSAAA